MEWARKCGNKALLVPPLVFSAIAESYIVSTAEGLPSDNLVPPPRLRYQYGDFSCLVLSYTPSKNYLCLHTLLSVNHATCNKDQE